MGRTVRVWATSDIHGNLTRMRRDSVECSPLGCDIAIFAGDTAPLSWAMDVREQIVWWQTEFREWVNQFKGTEFVIIPGNHDILFECDNMPQPDLPKNCHLLIDKGIELCGLSIYGTPWVPHINGNWAFESYKIDESDIARRYAGIPDGLDILVCHTPPRINGEKIDVSLDYENGTTPFGSVTLADAIGKKKPGHVFCGHIHSGSHDPVFMNENATEIRNVSHVNERYIPAYCPAIVEIKTKR